MNNSGDIRLSSNGYDLLEQYLTSLYGERGSFATNIKLYFSDPIHQCRTHSVSCIEDIRDISEDDIKSTITYMDSINNHVRSMVAEFDSYKGKVPSDVSLRMAQEMGLCPSDVPMLYTIFPFIMNFHRETPENLKDMLAKAKEKPRIIATMVFVMMEGLRYGHILTNHTGHKIWSQGYARNYYRGENAYYGSSKPSMFRSLECDKESEKITYVRQLQMIEFSKWLNSLNFIKKWEYGDVFHGAIAQHYGLPTNGMDVTSDLRTALFFACCKYENNTWRPLKDSEFENADSRENIKSIGGDSRYGVLFNLAADISSISAYCNNKDLHITSVTPVGIQPFVRCSAQSGFLVEAGLAYDMYKDPSFNKCKFRLSRQLCDWIFQEMDCGRKIYAPELCDGIDDIIQTVKSRKHFSKEAFEFFMGHCQHREDERENILNLLQEYGYEVVDDREDICSDERRHELEDTWFRNYPQSELINTPSTYRLRFSI